MSRFLETAIKQTRFACRGKISRLVMIPRSSTLKVMRYSNPLKAYRKAHGLTQLDVAQRMGLKNSSLISRWESGFSLPDLENVFQLAAVYGVTVDTLFQDLHESVQRRRATSARTTVNDNAT